MRLIRICAGAAMAAMAAGSAWGQESEAVKQLSVFFSDLSGRLIVMVPEQQTLPIKPDEFEGMLSGIAVKAAREAAAVDAAPDISVRAESNDLRKRLKDAYNTEGKDGWEKAMVDLQITDADYALTGRAVANENGFALTLRLIALQGGALVGVTEPVQVPVPGVNAVSPAQAFRAVADRMWVTAPDARDLAILPFKTADSSMISPAGEPMAILMMEAWLASAKASAETDALKGKEPARVSILPAADQGYTLSGNFWPLDDQIVRVALSLSEDGKIVAAEKVDILIRDLPPHLHPYLKPRPAPEGPLYGPFEALSKPDSKLSLKVADAAEPNFALCPPSGPTSDCGRLRLKLTADQKAHAICMALGDDGAFNLLAPAAHWGPVELEAGKDFHVPEMLPSDKKGNRPIWYAMGDPGAVLVSCVAYSRPDQIPLERLKDYVGGTLDRATALKVSAILIDSAPIGAAHEVVNLVRTSGPR